jgi:hypothetical protein
LFVRNFQVGLKKNIPQNAPEWSTEPYFAPYRGFYRTNGQTPSDKRRRSLYDRLTTTCMINFWQRDLSTEAACLKNGERMAMM